MLLLPSVGSDITPEHSGGECVLTAPRVGPRQPSRGPLFQTARERPAPAPRLAHSWEPLSTVPEHLGGGHHRPGTECILSGVPAQPLCPAGCP